MTDHPVDSTFHRCCRSIGGHGRDCPHGPAAIFAAAERERASAPAAEADHDVTVGAATANGRGYRAACRTCGWTSPGQFAEDTARRLAAEHYLAADNSDDSAELAAAMDRHPAGRARRHEAVITAAGQLHAGCSGCGWTFTGPIGREVVTEAAGHVEAAQVLGSLGVTR